jgi:hypothetical protein
MASVTELIGQSVWDADGVWIGHVVDIRVIKHRDDLQQAATVHGLLVSARRAPLPLGLPSWLSRMTGHLIYAGCTFVPWASVREYSDGEVHINSRRQELNRA